MKIINTIEHLSRETEKQHIKSRLALVASEDVAAIKSVIKASKRNIIEPVFIGDKKKIMKLCRVNNIDIARYEIVDETDPAGSAYRAVKLYKTGHIHMIMKGLINTRALLKVILDKDRGDPPDGILSHVGVCYIPWYKKLLLLTDAGVNVSPNLHRKVEIIKNAVDLARTLGIKCPKVAMVAAVESVNLPAMPATLDAKLLSRMSNSGLFKNVFIGGPFALDNALSKKAANYKGIKHPVAGDADILCVPDIECGNILYKAISVIAGHQIGGIVIGSNIPLVVASRSDPDKAKFLSIVLGAYYAHMHRKN